MFKFIILVNLLFSSCTIFLPEVYVATERTAAEKQLIGDFSESEELGQKSKDFHLFVQPYVVDSSKNLQDDSLQIYMNKKILISDEIYTLKKDGVIGENNRGFIEVIDNKKEINKRVLKVIDTENSVRMYIIKSYAKNKNISRKKATQDMYQYNLYVMIEGQYYQTMEGKWKKRVLK